MKDINPKEMSDDELATLACDLQNEIKTKKAQQSEVKSELFKRLKEQGKTTKGDGIETPSGSYVYSPTVSYNYPADVQKLKDKLSKAQEQAKNEGRVERVEKPNYRFKKLNL